MVLLVLEVLSQFIFPGGWYCGCCHLGFCSACLSLLTHFITILSFSAFLNIMHVIYVRICETILDSVPDALFGPVEQVTLEECLFLWVCKFLWEPIPDFGQECLHLGGKGRDRFFLPLICTVKVPHKQVNRLDITIHNCKFF